MKQTPFQLGLLMTLLMISSCVTAQYCGPLCPANVTEPFFVADPRSCAYFASCILDEQGNVEVGLIYDCGDGRFFNETAQVCMSVLDASEDFCSNLCNPCQVKCSTPGTLLPDPFNCSHYYACLNDLTPLLLHCEDTEAPYWDHYRLNCSSSPGLCYPYCDPCEPHCVTNEILSDPMDCQGFYMCNPPDVEHFLCPVGSVFDPDLGVCSRYSECVYNVCHNETMNSTSWY